MPFKDHVQKKENSPVQLEATEGMATSHSKGPNLSELGYASQQAALAPSGVNFADQQVQLSPVQGKEIQNKSDESVHTAAQQGTQGSGSALPHADKIQAAFGSHSIGGIQSYTGGAATTANESMGANAYASGSKIAFKSSPDVFTAAHEAAHVVQQRSGISLSGGVGKTGDSHEQHADNVANLVVQGKSAEPLLNKYSGGGAGAGIQFTGHPLDKALPEDAETPEHRGGREATKQRRYGVDQYIAMWEKEQGREMTAREKKTLDAGCIGITSLNLRGGGNPPLDRAYDSFEKAQEEMKKLNDMIRLHPEAPDGIGGKMKDWKCLLFAKMFWSNQKAYDPSLAPHDAGKSRAENQEAGMRANRQMWDKSDPNAFPVDPTTGKVDMTGYKYDWARPEMEYENGQRTNIDKPEVDAATGEKKFQWHVNFDYGFWDEASQCFWHANHGGPGMEVYQSTKEKFIAGYDDFDRIIFCVGFSNNYNPVGEAVRN